MKLFKVSGLKNESNRAYRGYRYGEKHRGTVPGKTGSGGRRPGQSGTRSAEKERRCLKKVVREFGERLLKSDGEIDRARLGEIVFKDPEALKRLNKIVHPVIDKTVGKRVGEARQKGVKVIVLEAAAMLEADKSWQVDEIWLTTAAEKTVLERLKARSGYTGAEAKRRIKSQVTDKERIKQADVVINNDGTPDELEAKVKTEWKKLLKRL